MLKQKIQQQNSGSPSAQIDNNNELLEVSELENNDASQTSLMLKLTDECTAAIKDAIRSKTPIQLKIVKGVPTIEVQHADDGKSFKFKCSLQVQPATDVIAYEPKQKIFKNVGTTTTVKMQVQATDKTFAEMKEKTQRLVEAEQQKKAKDMPKTQQKKQTTVRNHHQKSSTSATGTTSALHKLLSSNSSSSNKRTQSPSPHVVSNGVPHAKQLCREDVSKAATKGGRFGVPVASSRMEVVDRKATDAEPKKPVPQEAPVLKVPKIEPIKKDLFYVPKRKPINRAPSISPASTATSTPKTISPPLAMARPPSVDSTQLQHSSSCSPEDLAGNNNEEPGSMTLPLKASRDWSVEFGKIGSKEEARRFHECFKTEYPEYRQHYETMEQVADEFRKLQYSLQRAGDGDERLKIEDQIRSKFDTYQRDEDFLRKRQRHHDLRAKLEVIKKALFEWTQRGEMEG